MPARPIPGAAGVSPVNPSTRQPVNPSTRLPGRRAIHPAVHVPDDLARVPLVLPGRDNEMRLTFDLRCEQLGLRPRVRAEVEDMTLLHLPARDSDCVALMPTIVAQDEPRSGRLVEPAVVPELYENFCGVTVQRRYEPPLVGQLLARTDTEVLRPPPA